MDLLQKIESRQAQVAVIGLGYVGLPLAVAFAEAGFRVVGIDVDQARVDAINRGESYVSDVPSEQLAPLVGTVTSDQLPVISDQLTVNSDQSSVISQSPISNLQSPIPNTQSPISNLQSPIPNPQLLATTDYDALHDADVAIICVPTPLGKTKDPDMSYVIAATDAIAQRLCQGMLVVLESTTYPGTTEELILPRLQMEGGGWKGEGGEGEKEEREKGKREKGSPRSVLSSAEALVVGRDFFLAFSPERIDPGRTDYTIRNTPKVIGGVTPACTAVAQALYETAIERVVPVSSPRVAEMVKLLENTFRAVNIALVNEIAIICDRLGVDVWEVIETAGTKPFGFMSFYPGPGLGGHCIPIDPQYLAWKLKTVNYNARFIQLAGEINFGMPQYVLGKIADGLNEAGKPLKGSRVLILGVAYKAGVSDLRESPALDLIHLLQEKGADVAYHDPYVPRFDVDDLAMTGVSLDRHALRTADCVVITADHSFYDWEWVVENSRLVVDTRNATRDVRAGGARVVKL